MSRAFRNTVSLILLSFAFLATVHAQLSIAAENALPGNPISEWGVNSSADFRNVNLNGYATDISVNKGSTVHFKIDGQNGVNFTVKIYRLGYYGGLGARLQADLGTFPGVKQPAGISDPVTGLFDCSNWTESASWAVPANAVSGIYVARLESATAINNIVFIVRNDGSASKILFQASDATWQAYNGYGGSNLYNGITSFPAGHAVKVSYNRPFFIYNAGFATDGRGSDWYMNDDYPMIRWLERNGYDVTYTTNTDVALNGAQILSHKIFLSVGHDEYWSKEQRTNVEAARAAGVSLAFFSGNESYWKTRWEPDGNGNPNRVLVCYKEGTLADGTNGEAACGSKCDVSSPIWTGLWRMGAAYDAPLPENAMSGQISWWDNPVGAITVPDTYKNYRFWRNTSIASLAPGATATLAPNSLGYEWDFEQYPDTYPNGRMNLSSTTLNAHTHKLSLYRAPSGSLVFGAGTVQWMWGLDDQHFGGTGNVVSTDMQQATVNLFADMNVQPVTLQSDLVAATASTDVTPPTSAITSPANGSSVPESAALTISGTAADAATVGGVEISIDGGTTWKRATGTTNWSYTFTPTTLGTLTIRARGYDDSGNMQDGTLASGPNIITLNVTSAVCPCHVFTTQTPTETVSTDAQPIELGLKFRSSQSGFITGVRFYKSSGNNGKHVGELYALDGTRLATATFNGETASGWQYVNFATPVAVTANTTYIATYFSPGGTYTGTANYFTAAVVNDPLTGLADGTDGANGVYVYSATPAFPVNSPGNHPNYWVDPTFSPTSTAIAIAGSDQSIILPTNTASLDGSGSTGTITSYAWTQISGPNTAGISTPASVGTGLTGLIEGTYIFQLSVNGGESTSQVAVQVLAATTKITIFTTQIPGDPTSFDGQPIELGVKFRSSQAGYISGVRFFKTTGNNGMHIGQLYAADGTSLASATFTGETATGWQTVNFATPVAIAANTTYVAAYFSPGGTYVGTANYFASAVVNGPLTGLADGTDGANGEYLYTPGAAFPTTPSSNKSNYWVDAIYSAIPGPVAVAGPDQTIFLPTATVTLNGSASTGTITDYTWTMLSGPNTPGITTPNAVSTTVTGLVAGTYIFQLSINGGYSTSNLMVTVLPPDAEITIFTTQTPGDPTGNDLMGGIELGVKFQSSLSGYITGVRFYKTTGNDGVHVGQLYKADGTVLATATFTGESATGWQVVKFATPVAITSNTTYIAAYFSPDGTYTGTADYFANPVVNGPLTGLADGTDGPNGMYLYTASAAFPSNGSGNKSNYWVDAIFSTVPGPVAVAGPDQSIILPVSSVTVDGSASTGTITDYAWTTISGPTTPVITTPTAVSTTITGLAEGTYVFQLAINGGASTSQLTVTVLPVGSYLTILTTQTPVDPVGNDGSPIEVGVKFRSSTAGFIQGIRFYKSVGNAGVHIGELYAATGGAPIASATFTSETASGWQYVLFSSPVPIDANTTYVASYWSSLGNYTGTAGALASAITNGPLTALADGTEGANGVYLYTATPAFPTSEPNSKPNYWVDVLFTESSVPLPVTYLSFTASKFGRDAKLVWVTSMEENNGGFEVQRSTDGSTWNAIHFVTGAGNSQIPVTYEYIDNLGVDGGVYYYRLRQVDYDGKSKFSKVVKVDFGSGLNLELHQNYPNPVQSSTTITIVMPKAGKAQLMLYDQMGRPVRLLLDEVKMPGTYNIQMYRNGLSSGMYYYRLNALGETRVLKMTVY